VSACQPAGSGAWLSIARAVGEGMGVLQEDRQGRGRAKDRRRGRRAISLARSPLARVTLSRVTLDRKPLGRQPCHESWTD